MFCNCKESLERLKDRVDILESNNIVAYDLTDKQEERMRFSLGRFIRPTTILFNKLDELYAYLGLNYIKTESQESESKVIKIKKGGKK